MDVTLIMDKNETVSFVATLSNLLPEAVFAQCKCSCNTILIKMPDGSVHKILDGHSIRIVNGNVVTNN